MKAFDKLCLTIGKIVVYCISFLSFFYTADLICNRLKPYVNEGLVWVSEQKILITLGAFCFILLVLGITKIFTRKKTPVYKSELDSICPDLVAGRKHRSEDNGGV